MISTKKLSGFVLATAAASLFATAGITPAVAAKQEGKVNCTGVNACKGKSECANASNACKGQNACKGKGMTSMASAKACTDKGGKVDAPKT